MFTKFSVLAAIAGLTAAYHVPVGPVPVGNPISNPLNSIAPVGEPLKITWTPTTANTVSLILLKGPSTNAVYYETIVEGIVNSGSYSWTPEASLPGTTGNTGYGIQLIDDVNGQYQYSTQFGIKNDEVIKSSSSSAAGYPVSTSAGPVYSVPASSAPVYSAPASSSSANTTVYYPTSVGTTSHYVASTGYPMSNSSVIYPTGSMTVPSSLRTTATLSGTSAPSASAPIGTGAASPLRAGLGLAGAMAAAAFAL